MAPSEDKMIANIATWLKKQGYPLEMRAAKILKSKNMWVSMGKYYRDIETNTQRETDIYASAERDNGGDEALDINLVIECKSSSEKPWILFVDRKKPPSPSILRGLRLRVPKDGWLQPACRNASRAGRKTPILDGYPPFGYALAQAFKERNEDHAFDGIISAAKAAAGIHQELSNDPETPIRSVVIPMLLIGGPLVQCELDDDNDDMHLTPISAGTLMWKYQLSSDHPRTTLIHVLTPPALPEFADDVNTTADSLFAAVIEKKKRAGALMRKASSPGQ
ncbi:hypothetical protein ACWEKT_39535 [Nocardia takedensis]